MVKITEGVNKGKPGTVKHIYNDFLFLYNVEFLNTNCIFVETANNCYLTSSNLNTKRRFFNYAEN